MHTNTHVRLRPASRADIIRLITLSLLYDTHHTTQTMSIRLPLERTGRHKYNSRHIFEVKIQMLQSQGHFNPWLLEQGRCRSRHSRFCCSLVLLSFNWFYQVVPTSSGSWSDFITWTTLNYMIDWLIDGLANCATVKNWWSLLEPTWCNYKYIGWQWRNFIPLSPPSCG